MERAHKYLTERGYDVPEADKLAQWITDRLADANKIIEAEAHDMTDRSDYNIAGYLAEQFDRGYDLGYAKALMEARS